MAYSYPDDYVIFDGSANPVTGKVIMLKRVGSYDQYSHTYIIMHELKVIGEIV